VKKKNRPHLKFATELLPQNLLVFIKKFFSTEIMEHHHRVTLNYPRRAFLYDARNCRTDYNKKRKKNLRKQEREPENNNQIGANPLTHQLAPGPGWSEVGSFKHILPIVKADGRKNIGCTNIR